MTTKLVVRDENGNVEKDRVVTLHSGSTLIISIAEDTIRGIPPSQRQQYVEMIFDRFGKALENDDRLIVVPGGGLSFQVLQKIAESAVTT